MKSKIISKGIIGSIKEEVSFPKISLADNPNKYYPVLKSGNWMGLDAGVDYDVLVGTKQDPKLVVCYATFSNGNFMFYSGKNNLDKKRVKQTLDKESRAFTFLSNYDNEALILHKGVLNAEQLLSVQALTLAHEMLQEELIYVAIPKRDALYVCTPKALEENRNALENFVLSEYTEACKNTNAIVPAIIGVKNGEIVSYEELTA